MSTDCDLAEALGIERRAGRVARNLAARQANGELGWAPQLRELIAFARIADVLGTWPPPGTLIGQAPEEDRDVVASVITSAFGATVTPLSLGPASDTPPPAPRSPCHLPVPLPGRTALRCPAT